MTSKKDGKEAQASKNSLSVPCQTPKGVHDILPKDHEYHTYIKKVVRHRARQAGFKRISTPMFEYTDIFARSLGGATDIVEKEMYTFKDKKGRSLTLKPEGTAGVARAYIQHSMDQLAQPVKLYYIEPHFRYDRPQKGRYRQFWQFGFEVMGELNPCIDAQIIFLANKINEDLGISELFDIQLNTIGSKDDRDKYMQGLKDYYYGKERSLCKHCKVRLEQNPMRLLDCKNEDCKILAELAPKMTDYLSKKSIKYYEEVKEYLDELGIKYKENPKLVRGLDYYTNTVFEFWDSEEGAQNAIGGGGRFDGLIEQIGGNSVPAVGYAAGMERIIAQMKREKIGVPSKDNIHVFVAQLGKSARKKCLGLIDQMREAGLKTIGALGKGSMKKQLKLAHKFDVPYTLILGVTEVREGTIIIRDMERGSQEVVKFDQVIDELIEKIGEENLDKYSPDELIY